MVDIAPPPLPGGAFLNVSNGIPSDPFTGKVVMLVALLLLWWAQVMKQAKRKVFTKRRVGQTLLVDTSNSWLQINSEHKYWSGKQNNSLNKYTSRKADGAATLVPPFLKMDIREIFFF